MCLDRSLSVKNVDVLFFVLVPPIPTAVPEAVVPKRMPDAPVLTQVPLNAPLKLPPRWRVAKDSRGYSYYYHIKVLVIRVCQVGFEMLWCLRGKHYFTVYLIMKANN